MESKNSNFQSDAQQNTASESKVNMAEGVDEEGKVTDPANSTSTCAESLEKGSEALCFPVHDLKHVFFVAGEILESVKSVMSRDTSDATVTSDEGDNQINNTYGHVHPYLMKYITKLTTTGVVIGFPGRYMSLETISEEVVDVTSDTDADSAVVATLHSFEKVKQITTGCNDKRNNDLGTENEDRDDQDITHSITDLGQPEQEVKDKDYVRETEEGVMEMDEEVHGKEGTVRDTEEGVLGMDKEVLEKENVEEKKEEGVLETEEEVSQKDEIHEMEEVVQEMAKKVQEDEVCEMKEEHVEEEKPNGPVFFIKRNEDNVDPFEPYLLFRSDIVQSQELQIVNEMFGQQLEDLLTSVPASQRQDHFRMADKHQYISYAMNERFNTKALDMDSIRIYETLAVTYDILWPTVPNKTEDGECNILFLCPPTGGVVSGTKLFLDTTRPQLKTDWIGLTRHPWQEGTSLDKIVLNDHILHWKRENWRFVLDQDLAITTREQVENLTRDVEVGLGKKADLIVADLTPSQINMESQGYELTSGLAKALVTEAAEIELSLKVLNKGGNLILSLINPVDLTCTLGNVGFLTGLFSTVAVRFPDPSSTWLRPAMLVCCNYVGINVFQTKYPDFAENYLSSIARVCVSSTFVMLDTVDMPESVASGLEKMGNAWVEQERLRLYSLSATYADTNNALVYERLLGDQVQMSQDWMQEMSCYVTQTINEWNVIPQVAQVCDEDAMLTLKQLWEIEGQLTDEAMEFSLNRLQQTFINESVSFPDQLKTVLKDVPTIKDEKIVRELFPSTMSFSRFASTKIIYDYLVVRKVGSYFPVPGLSREIKSGVPQTCGNHVKVNLQHALARQPFQVYVSDETLVMACLNFTSSMKLSSNESDIHQKIFETLLEPIKAPKVLDRNDSLFACMMPLTSRLLVGSVCVISKCFNRTMLVASKKDRMMGVLFEGFKGRRDPTTQMVKNVLESLIRELEMKRDVNMEIIPFKSHFECVDLSGLVQYNDAIISKTTLTLVNVVIGSLKEYYTVGPSY